MKSRTRRPRLRGKVRNRKKFNWGRFARRLVWVAAFAAVAVGGVWVCTTPDLAIRAIRIDGNHIASDDEIRRLARSALGKNILLVNTREIQRAVLRRPEVARVRVRRMLPNTLILKVTERKAWATITAGGGFYEMDSTRLIFRRVRSPDARVPLISLSLPVRLKVGQRPREADVAAAVECLAYCERTGWRACKLSVDRERNVCLNMGDGYYIKLGQAERVGMKLAKARMAIRARPELAREILYIDVSCPSRPAYKPKPSARGVNG